MARLIFASTRCWALCCNQVMGCRWKIIHTTIFYELAFWTTQPCVFLKLSQETQGFFWKIQFHESEQFLNQPPRPLIFPLWIRIGGGSSSQWESFSYISIKGSLSFSLCKLWKSFPLTWGMYVWGNSVFTRNMQINTITHRDSGKMGSDEENSEKICRQKGYSSLAVLNFIVLGNGSNPEAPQSLLFSLRS